VFECTSGGDLPPVAAGNSSTPLGVSSRKRSYAALDRLSTLSGVGWGISLALEGTTVSYPGVTYREAHNTEGQRA
jgi:hypothetical protein